MTMIKFTRRALLLAAALSALPAWADDGEVEIIDHDWVDATRGRVVPVRLYSGLRRQRDAGPKHLLLLNRSISAPASSLGNVLAECKPHSKRKYEGAGEGEQDKH